MKILILRHGEAQYQTGDDRNRHLTPRGERDAFNAGKFLAECAPELQRIVASPFRRAQQTAAQVQKSFRHLPIDTVDAITPDDDAQAVIDWLAQQTDDSVLLVSHMPLVGRLTGLLSDGAFVSAPAFGTASMAAIDCEMVAAGCGRVLWLRHAADY